ncbi:hypothetical protein CAC01_05825 [Streptomyces sp. CLI2509]|nr:hypothetical protein CAC01_05825 [Streptomyces sp. CLI2509]
MLRTSLARLSRAPAGSAACGTPCCAGGLRTTTVGRPASRLGEGCNRQRRWAVRGTREWVFTALMA